MNEYAAFIEKKSQIGSMSGFKPLWMADFLFDFQQSLVEWSTRKGRSAIFADCGLGKTPMQLVWAENVRRHTNKPVLILAPLAVSAQTVREADKFGIDCKQSREGKVMPNITVTNYERIHYFNPADFSGVVCDESSAIKAMDGKRKAIVTEFMRTMQYRLLCTATAAPNDYVELGTSSEALGYMGQRDMITMFFKQLTKKDYLGWGRTKYILKGHADKSFWRWVCSWARAVRKPSDLGFSDDGLTIPPLTETTHVIKARTLPPGWLFDVPAQNMQEEKAERRRTINERCERVAELVAGSSGPVVVWCHLNDEGDVLSSLIKDSRQVSGSLSDDQKESAYDDFATGRLRVLVIKPKIGAWGLNWQHCSNVVTFASHSYEQYYQAVRRCWRFGQKKPVTVDIVISEGEEGVSKNLEEKSKAARNMFSALVENMNDSLGVKSTSSNNRIEVPSWA